MQGAQNLITKETKFLSKQRVRTSNQGESINGSKGANFGSILAQNFDRKVPKTGNYLNTAERMLLGKFVSSVSRESEDWILLTY